ncbi:hypothetical protein MRS76_19090 [Rhizobiaceae bacterium n13]|uniref:Citrate lyase subunit beta/citryl-CoA lyase n=1 Tax=Ferirhizobium litorale TaxID=2927786 RepID=A0AAE3QFY9_9HYPH|nr:hypothetical protein [Fererhizobium litorale]MDI7864057.1 hypothetical protein [Fererhizobium litorale]MDI7924460.1 hypothetical protein [Fererhizobium litorale]
MRSWLRLATLDEKSLARTARTHADRLVFDLACIGPQEPSRSRNECAAFLRLSQGLRRYVVVHDFASGECEDDLAAIFAEGPDGIILAGAQNGAEIQRLDVLLSTLEAVNDVPLGRTRIVARCDTAAGILGAASYRAKSERLEAVGWSPVALANEIGATDTYAADGRLIAPLQQAQGLIQLAAAAAGVAALAADEGLVDAEVFSPRCREARAVGFAGMMTSDPARVAIINQVFG